MEEQAPRPKRPRGIYLLPNLFTTAALFAGFYAVVAANQGRFEPAAIAIFAAMILDGLDGRVARLTHTQSDFGAEYDSLSDMVAVAWACSGLLLPGRPSEDLAVQGVDQPGRGPEKVYPAAGAVLRVHPAQKEVIDPADVALVGVVRDAPA
jgi:hypothetical protein